MKQPEKNLSVIIPARNEEALIGQSIEAILCSAADLHGEKEHGFQLERSSVEVIVVDNLSTDGTARVTDRYVRRQGVQRAECHKLRAASARNMGARLATGRILVFVDADTIIAPHTLARILHWCDIQACQAGITNLASLEGGRLAWCWWTFWGQVRRLPLARAKAMPALMFCTRPLFHELGPFDERVAIGEEWPILAGLYRRDPRYFVYDRALTALTSSRRMELESWGYARTFLRYAWAVLHFSGRINYGDHCRYSPEGGL